MWRLLKSIGGAFCYVDYGGSTGAGERRPDGTDSLDRVDCAGQANMARLRSAASVCGMFALIAIAVIMDEESFRNTCLTDAKVYPRRQKVKEMWVPHLKMLIEDKVLEDTDEGRPLSLADVQVTGSYFEVWKVFEDNSTRTIFDGRDISGLGPRPPPVNTVELKEQLRMMHEQGLTNYVVADIRHWFHQLPLARAIRRFFCLIVPGCIMRMCVVPMGWSWSPWVAQNCAWLVLLHVPEGGKPIFDSYATTEALPHFVIRSGSSTAQKGQEVDMIAFLLYDNFVIGCRTPTQAEEVGARLKGNAAFFNIAIKTLEVWTYTRLLDREKLDLEMSPQEISDEETGKVKVKRCIHLGVEFGITPGPDPRLKWRHPRRKLSKWESSFQGCSAGEKEVRLVASWVGILLWDGVVRRIPLQRRIGLLNIASAVGRKGAGQGWKAASRLTLSEDQSALLGQLRDEMLGSAWTTVDSIILQGDPIILATDASNLRWGCLRLYLTGPQRFSHLMGENFSKEFGKLHIFYKELGAAVWAIERLSEEERQRPIVLVIDNAAAAGALRRGVSTTLIGNELLSRIPERVMMTMKVISIPSEANPADSPSRNAVVKRSKMWLKVIDDCIVHVGKLLSTGAGSELVGRSRTAFGGIRHREPEEEDPSLEPVEAPWLVVTVPEEAVYED